MRSDTSASDIPGVKYTMDERVTSGSFGSAQTSRTPMIPTTRNKIPIRDVRRTLVLSTGLVGLVSSTPTRNAINNSVTEDVRSERKEFRPGS